MTEKVLVTLAMVVLGALLLFPIYTLMFEVITEGQVFP